MALASALTDNFNDNSLNAGLWSAYADPGTSVAEANQRLELTLRANGTGYAGLASLAKYDLTGSFALVECPDRGTGGSGQTASLELELDASNALKVITDGTGIMAQTVIAGVNTSFGIISYSAVTHRWWRVREAGGSVFFETSPTGAPGSWTALYSRTNPFALTALTLKLFGGTYASVATPGVPKFDNLNLPGPGQAALPASDASVGTWTTDAGAATNLYQRIDEPDFNDADYIQSVAGPATTVYEAALSALTDPASSAGHAFQIRALLDVAGPPATLTSEIRQGASALSTPATWSDAPTATAQTFAHTLTGPQTDAITDYGALRLRVTADQPAQSATAPTFVAAGTYVQTAVNAATLTPGLPAGWAADDIHLLIAGRKDNTAMTALSGWTQHALLFGNNSTGLRTEVWWRRAVAGDTAPVVTFGSSTILREAQILGIRGCPPTGSPFSQTSAPADAVSRRVNPSATAVLTTSVTPTENSLAVVVFTQASGPTTATQISGAFTVFTVNRSGNNGIGLGYCTGVSTWNANTALAPTTTTSQAGLNDGLLLAMRPTPGAPATSRVRVTWAALLAPPPPNFVNLTGATVGAATEVGTVTARRRLAAGAGGLATVAVTLGRIPRPVRDLTGAAAGVGQIGTAFLWGGGGVYGTAVWGATGITIITGGPPPAGPKNLTGSAAGAGAVTAAPTRRRPLTGATAGTGAVTAAPSRRPTLTGAAVGAGASTASPSRRRVLVAAAAGTSTEAGTVTARRRLAAAAAGAGTALGFVDLAGSVFRPIFGGAVGRTTSAGAVARRRALAAATAGAAAATGAPSRRRPLASAAVLGRATATAVVQRKKSLLAPTALGQATASGTVTILAQLPLTSVVWVVDHFEMSRTGTHVLWGDLTFLTTGGHPQVTWEEDEFRVYQP